MVLFFSLKFATMDNTWERFLLKHCRGNIYILSIISHLDKIFDVRISNGHEFVLISGERLDFNDFYFSVIKFDVVDSKIRVKFAATCKGVRSSLCHIREAIVAGISIMGTDMLTINEELRFLHDDVS